jgi:hypothetical protein
MNHPPKFSFPVNHHRPLPSFLPFDHADMWARFVQPSVVFFPHAARAQRRPSLHDSCRAELACGYPLLTLRIATARSPLCRPRPPGGQPTLPESRRVAPPRPLPRGLPLILHQMRTRARWCLMDADNNETTSLLRDFVDRADRAHPGGGGSGCGASSLGVGQGSTERQRSEEGD